MPRTHTFYGPGCPHCGHLYASRTDAQTHACDPETRDTWHKQRCCTEPAPGLVDLGNGFVLRLPEDAR